MSTIFDGTNGITFPDGSVQNTMSAFGFRNRIINGDMRIDQRNAGAAATVGVGAYYLDRFYLANTTATGTIVAQQSTLNGAKSLLVTATAAVTDLTTSKVVQTVAQAVEAQNIFDLNSKPVTLSFKVQTNWAGKLAVSFKNGANNRSYITDVSVTAGLNNIVLPNILLEAATTAAPDNGTGLIISIGSNNAGTLQTTTTGSWVAGAFLCSNLSTNWALTTGNYINITEVQLEPGTVATPFERRPIGAELTLCQRYYNAITIAMQGYHVAGNIIAYQATWQSMRAVPTTAFSGGTYSNMSGISATNVLTNGARIGATVTTTGGGQFNDWFLTLSAEL